MTPDPTLPNPMIGGERAKPVIWLLTDQDVHDLARYNAERLRGLVHTDEWRAKMARYQAAFDLKRGIQPLPEDRKRRRGWRATGGRCTICGELNPCDGHS
jgi:hypothetical protein